MLTLEPGSLDVGIRRGRERAAAGLAGPGLALAGTAAGALAADSCGTALALPVSALALTVTGALLWLAGVPRERRDRIVLAVAAALALLSLAALQQLLACTLGRDGMIAAELFRAGGMIVLAVAVVLAVVRMRRERTAAAERRRAALELFRGAVPESTRRFAPGAARAEEPAPAAGRRR